MKRIIPLLALLLSFLLPLSGCATLVSLAPSEASPTAMPAAVPTQPPAPAAEPTSAPTPTPVPTAAPDFSTALTGCTWIAYCDTEGIEHFVFELTFYDDGTMEYMAGWYLSEVAYYGTGTYTVDAESIEYNLSSDRFEPASIVGSAAYTIDGGLLTLSLGSGDALTYLLETKSLTFAIKGSEQDCPPFTV